MMQNTAYFVLTLPWSVCMPGSYLPLQLDEYFQMCLVSFCLVISLPLTKEDAFQQDGPELHHRFLL